MELNEVCELIVDCEHKTAPTQETGYPSIRTPNIARGRFILDGVNRVSEETYQLWTRRAVPQPGDLIMAREAPVGNLSDEQQRHVRENMSEEELVIFDILTRPAPELTTEERAEVKKVARLLLDRLKQLLVINWRQKSGARASLKLAIEDTLDTGLPRAYDKPLYEQKCSALFEHIYESYPERDVGVYAEAG